MYVCTCNNTNKIQILTSNCTYILHVMMYHTVIGSPAIKNRPLSLEFTFDQIKYSWSKFKPNCMHDKIFYGLVFLSQ